MPDRGGLGLPFIAIPSRFTAAVDELVGGPPYCAAEQRGGGWLAPGANDDHSTVEGGELPRCGGLGGAAHGGDRCGRRRAAKRLAGDAAGGEEAVGAFGMTRREGEDQDELGETYPGGVLARTRARAKRALCSRSGRARHLFDEMPGQPKLLEC